MPMRLVKVTLVLAGLAVVGNQMDKLLAETRPKSVSGTFAINDELRVEG